MGMVAQSRTQKIHESEAHVGIQQPIDRRGSRVLDQTMDQFCLPSGLGKAVSVNRHHHAAAHSERGAEGLKFQTQISLPEVAIPAVVVSPYHYYWHLAAQLSQSRRNVETTARNDPGVREPEVEQIAVHQQAVA